MGAPFWTNQEAADRLNNSIILYKKYPYIAEVSNSEAGLFNLHEMDSYKKVIKDTSYLSDDFYYGSFELGWLTFGDDAFFMRRYPARSHNEGLHRNNLVNHREFFNTTAFRDCILGTYPTFKQAKSVAFNRVRTPFGRYSIVERLDKFNAEIKHLQKTIGYLSIKGNVTLLESSCPSMIKTQIMKKIGINQEDL